MADCPAAQTPLARRVRADIDSRALLRDVRLVLVACSGGSDSVALLELLVELRADLGVEVVVAHLDHGQRAGESAVDARFVADLAAAHGLEAVVETAEATSGRASEAELRRLRQAFFRRAVERTGADAVALGHTLDDQAETVLFNLARGAARPGLAGMRPRRRVDGVLLLRPLLRIRREELREHLRERQQRWRDDSSNADLRYTRNLLRQRIVKELEGAVPGAVANIGRAAALLQLEEAWIAELVGAAYAQVRIEGAQGVALDMRQLGEHPRALQTRLVREALCEVRGDLRGLTREHVDAVLDEVVAGVEAARDLPGVRVRRQDERLEFLPLKGRRLQDSGRQTQS